MADFKRIFSNQAFSRLRDTSKISFQYGKHMATYVSAFTMIMKTCKGRDKICSVIQYIADFYYNCNKYSEIQEVLKECLEGRYTGANIAHKIRGTMKNTRKIFKFLKWIDQIASIIKNVQSEKPLYLKIVIVMQHLMAMLSNFFDNIIWAINTDIISIWYSSKLKKFKAFKYRFSLGKLIFKMLSNNYKHQSRIKNMKEILNELKKFKEEQISSSDITYDLCKEYLKQRYEIRIEEIDGGIMILRFIMLVRKLKLPGYTYVTKILYSCCGLISTFLATYKMILDQPILVELKEKKLKNSTVIVKEGFKHQKASKEFILVELAHFNLTDIILLYLTLLIKMQTFIKQKYLCLRLKNLNAILDEFFDLQIKMLCFQFG